MYEKSPIRLSVCLSVYIKLYFYYKMVVRKLNILVLDKWNGTDGTGMPVGKLEYTTRELVCSTQLHVVCQLPFFVLGSVGECLHA